MTRNRDIPRDQQETAALLELLVVDPQAALQQAARRPNWLGHGGRPGQTGSAQIDAALLQGATAAELRACRRAWQGHLNHLGTDHGLTVVRQGRIYKLQSHDQEEAADNPIEADQPLGLPDDVIAPVGLGPDPQANALGLSPDRCCGFVVLPNAPEERAVAFLFDNVDAAREHLANFAERIVFIVTGVPQAAVHAAVEAVASVWNIWVDDRPAHPLRPEPVAAHRVRPRQCWNDAWQPANGGHYVYEYRSPEGQTFYVGKGQGRRAAAHVEQVRRLLANDAPLATFTRKQRAIFSGIHAGQAEGLHRIVADFNGPYAELCAFAVERFLICSVHGVHHLTNDTQGDSRWSVNGHLEAGCNWLCKPRSNNARLEDVWRQVAQEFVLQGTLFQTARNDLLWLVVEPWIFDIRQQLGLLEDQNLDYIGAGNNGSGVSIDWNIRDLPVRIQLVFSARRTDAGINLRPRAPVWRTQPSEPDRQEFGALVTERLQRPGGVAIEIRIPEARDCFVKPYSAGMAHPRLDISDDATAVRVRSLFQDTWLELNFVGAIEHVLDALRR